MLTLSLSPWRGWTPRPSFPPQVKTCCYFTLKTDLKKHSFSYNWSEWGINLNLMSLPLQNTWSAAPNKTTSSKNNPGVRPGTNTIKLFTPAKTLSRATRRLQYCGNFERLRWLPTSCFKKLANKRKQRRLFHLTNPFRTWPTFQERQQLWSVELYLSCKAILVTMHCIDLHWRKTSSSWGTLTRLLSKTKQKVKRSWHFCH